jgi:hypothetical protein
VIADQRLTPADGIADHPSGMFDSSLCSSGHFSGKNRPLRAAARSRFTRSRTSACCSNAIRSAAAIKPWVGRTQAVGHRVIPLDRINSATASRYSSASLIKSSMFHTAGLSGRYWMVRFPATSGTTTLPFRTCAGAAVASAESRITSIWKILCFRLAAATGANYLAAAKLR